MANILIIAVNRQRLPYPAAPIGAAMIVGALNKAQHKARLLDLGPAFHVRSALRRAIQNFSPDLIGFSMRNLDSCVMTAPDSFLPEVKKVVDAVRQATSVPMIIGGAAFSLAPLEILNALELEWGVVGEGERTCVALFERLLSGKTRLTSPAWQDAMERFTPRKACSIWTPCHGRTTDRFLSKPTSGGADSRAFKPAEGAT